MKTLWSGCNPDTRIIWLNLELVKKPKMLGIHRHSRTRAFTFDLIIDTVPMIMGRRSIAASVIGGIAETQEMLDFCAEHNIVPDVEMIAMQDINTAYERMQKSDVKYRFVIDMASPKA